MPSRAPTDNTGSHARDHLANERTFLAWLRTGLAFIGLGVLVAKFTDQRVSTQIGGLILIAVGAVMLVYSVFRYERVAHLLDEGKFQSARLWPAVLGALAFVTAISAVVFILV
ncbi:MAG: DUF202 domain-containing protein [Acidimicrobiia bacterium]